MFTPPALSGEPCGCDACRIAGVSDRPVVRAPNGELHGKALADWYQAREKALRAIQAFRLGAHRMPSAEVQVDPEGKPL